MIFLKIGPQLAFRV